LAIFSHFRAFLGIFSRFHSHALILGDPCRKMTKIAHERFSRPKSKNAAIFTKIKQI